MIQVNIQHGVFLQEEWKRTRRNRRNSNNCFALTTDPFVDPRHIPETIADIVTDDSDPTTTVLPVVVSPRDDASPTNQPTLPDEEETDHVSTIVESTQTEGGQQDRHQNVQNLQRESRAMFSTAALIVAYYSALATAVNSVQFGANGSDKDRAYMRSGATVAFVSFILSYVLLYLAAYGTATVLLELPEQRKSVTRIILFQHGFVMFQFIGYGFSFWAFMTVLCTEYPPHAK